MAATANAPWGIAKQIQQTFPEAFAADKATLKGLREKLGTLSHATVVRGGRQITIVNAYTQFHWRGAGCWPTTKRPAQHFERSVAISPTAASAIR